MPITWLEQEKNRREMDEIERRIKKGRTDEQIVSEGYGLRTTKAIRKNLETIQRERMRKRLR